MIAIFAVVLFFGEIYGLKTWILNTDMNNKLNWDLQDAPQNCDNINFQMERDIATVWNLKDIAIAGLSLPSTGSVLFPQNIKVQFRNKEKCPQVRDIKFVRNKSKGWLDPENWKSDSELQWLPHFERVPCAGESVLFPPEQTYAVQLPSVLVPLNTITFDNEEFGSDTWFKFLKTELAYKIFEGPDDVRNFKWRTDSFCNNRKKCFCSRYSYTIKDGSYKEVDPQLFEEAVCFYAKPNCESTDCYSPVIPEGHCCGICGAVVNLEDKTMDGLDINNIKKEVETELHKLNYENELKTYVGRTKSEIIQIVIVAENSGDTLKSHVLADTIIRNLKDQNLRAKISSLVSGLTLSNYIFNSASGVAFGTLFAIVTFFVSIFYIYVILPKKKFSTENPFMFARFDNTLHEAASEENLQLGAEAEPAKELPQAFDNPMYSGNSKQSTSGKGPSDDLSQAMENKNISEKTISKEYTNPVYKELEKSEKLDLFQGDLQKEEVEEFCEIKL